MIGDSEWHALREMLLHRVVNAESALRTILEHTWTQEQVKTIAKRALDFNESKIAAHLKQYPDK